MRLFALIIILYLAGFFAHAFYLKKTVYGDGIFYYSWLRSIVIDHDFNFTDEYQYFHAGQPPTRYGLPGNKYSVGPALLWAPAYLWIDSIIKGKGFEFPYQLAVGLTGVCYALVGLILLYRLLSQFFPEKVGRLAVLGVALATNLFYYGSLDTVNSHALSFFAVTLFLSFLLHERKNWLLIGLSLGLVGLIRPQDMVIGVTVIPFFKPKYLVYFFLGLFIEFLPQLLAWQTLYREFWISPYLIANEYFDFLHPHIQEVLFAPWYGLFFYSPVLLLGIIGLIMWKNQIKAFVCFALLLELLLISSWSTWWQGASVGGRMFIGCLPLLALGLGQFFEKNWQSGWNVNIFLLIFVVPLTCLNLILTFSYLWLH